MLYHVKEFIDRSCALLLLVAVAPLMLFVSLLVFVMMGRPIFFCQDRPGKIGKVFKFYKFRTMTDDTDENGNLLDDSQRLTSFGKFLRKSSLDELPQLMNVLLGHMSFVGPRPLLVEYLDRYTEEQFRRHDVLPGITGWAQVNGRNSISWNEKFELDIWYVDNWSLKLDFKILFLTVWKVFKQADISQENHPTMKKFTGDTLS